jgi:hypothetical protein
MVVMLVALAGVVVTQASCQGLGHAVAALGKISQGAQYLGTLIEVAETGSALYFDRHPNVEAERDVKQRLREARLAQQAFDASLAAAKSATDGDVAGAKANAVAAYGKLRDLLESLGVLKAIPPAGGAETDAPTPQPFDLPEPSKVEALLEA